MIYLSHGKLDGDVRSRSIVLRRLGCQYTLAVDGWRGPGVRQRVVNDTGRSQRAASRDRQGDAALSHTRHGVPGKEPHTVKVQQHRTRVVHMAGPAVSQALELRNRVACWDFRKTSSFSRNPPRSLCKVENSAGIVVWQRVDASNSWIDHACLVGRVGR